MGMFYHSIKISIEDHYANLRAEIGLGPFLFGSDKELLLHGNQPGKYRLWFYKWFKHWREEMSFNLLSFKNSPHFSSLLLPVNFMCSYGIGVDWNRKSTAFLSAMPCYG